ncbi:fla cluster protein FlaF [Haloferax sp. YSMS24]|uniref:fla cluster protein FlaF n=1 Tax=unclassified Haloferax TaxID=2625095 RepID=UPI00398CCF87
MGFGVSGSTAIIFLGVLIATGTLYTATSNATENVLEAQSDDSELTLERKNTAITVANATYDSGNATLVVNVTNTGASTLAVDETTVLVDNDYSTPDTTSVGGSQSTNVWPPGENLTVEVTNPTQPTRVKVVTGAGVAATGGVS